jgi:hypothetical protein
MQAQTQPSTSPPQTPHTHPAPRPDPRSTLCHADPAAHAHSHSSSFSLSLSLSDRLSHTHTHTLTCTHWQHTGNTLTDTQTLTDIDPLSRVWSTAVPAFTLTEKVTACQHNTWSSHTCQKQHQDRNAGEAGTYQGHCCHSQRHKKIRNHPRSQSGTFRRLPEAPAQARADGWGAVPSPDGTHLCSQEVTRHTTHIWQGSSTTELKPVLLQLGLSSPVQADTHAPVYRLQSLFCSTGRWTDCSLLPAVGQGSAHCRAGCRPKSCCHQTGHLTDLD